MAGESFEFTPMGIVPAGSGPVALKPGEISAGGAALEKAQTQAVAPLASLPAASPIVLTRQVQHVAAPPHEPLNRREWSRELKARLKVVRAELKRLRALADEEAELLRLIHAAKQPPAKVRSVDFSRGRTG